jgi:hypothetical protein
VLKGPNGQGQAMDKKALCPGRSSKWKTLCTKGFLLENRVTYHYDAFLQF